MFLRASVNVTRGQYKDALWAGWLANNVNEEGVRMLTNFTAKGGRSSAPEISQEESEEGWEGLAALFGGVNHGRTV